MEANQPTSVGVIIPTYNRRDSLLSTLDSLGQQTLPQEQIEVIVVDDGSTDGTEHLDWRAFPFHVQYCRQENVGATKARNTGAAHCSADILTFMDDDIVATPDMLKYLVQPVSDSEKTITLATLVPAFEGAASPFAIAYSSGAVFPKDVDPIPTSRASGCFVHFSKCKTGVLCINRKDFVALDMFQDPTGGWPNWDDVDFGYRAHLKGFRLWRSYQAIAYHHDHALKSLELNCRRQEQASQSATHFFTRYPELTQHFPAYHHKRPLSFSTDSLAILMRKALRSILSVPPLVTAMQHMTHILEEYNSDSRLLILLYRWIIGAYIYRGYRRGLRELSQAKA